MADNTSIVKIEKEAKELETEMVKLSGEYSGFMIATPEDYTKSGEILQKIKGKYALLDDREKEITRPMEQAKKSVIALFKRPKQILEGLEVKIKDAILTFQEKQEAERRKKEEELKKIQEAEAKKLEAKANKTKNEDKKAELLAAAESTRAIAPQVAPNIPKVEGISMAENWAFEIVNKDLIPREYMIPDEVTLGKVARATRGSLHIPGIRIYSYKGVKASKK